MRCTLGCTADCYMLHGCRVPPWTRACGREEAGYLASRDLFLRYCDGGVYASLPAPVLSHQCLCSSQGGTRGCKPLSVAEWCFRMLMCALTAWCCADPEDTAALVSQLMEWMLSLVTTASK